MRGSPGRLIRFSRCARAWAPAGDLTGILSQPQRGTHMREYKGSEIRNIAVVGHGASGKTSLVDALAFVSGSQ